MPSNTSNEEWRAIPGFEGVYDVSSFGKIRSLDRIITEKTGKSYILKSKHRNLSTDSKGYLRVSANVNGKVGCIYVHQAIAKAFIGPYPTSKHEVRHLDGNRINNVVNNIAYGTKSDNMQDALKHGTFLIGVDRPGAILTPDKARAICLDTRHFAIIAEVYGITDSAVRAVKSGKNWGYETKKERFANPYIGRRKRTTEEVLEICDMRFTRASLSTKFGVTKTTIDSIRRKNR